VQAAKDFGIAPIVGVNLALDNSRVTLLAQSGNGTESGWRFALQISCPRFAQIAIRQLCILKKSKLYPNTPASINFATWP
jgi:hypothetical protein